MAKPLSAVRIKLLKLACLICFISCATIAQAKFKDVVANLDAGVSSGNPGTNYGSDTSFYIQSASAANSFGNQFGWLQFDLTNQIPAGATISSIKLRMFNFDADDQGDDLPIAIHSSTDDSWTETGITYSNQPVFSGTAIATGTLDAPNQFRWYEFDVTSFVQAEYAGDGKVSLVIKPVSEGDDQWKTFQFNSREFNTNTTPKLRIEYTGNWPSADPVNIIHINDIHSRLTTHDLDFPDGPGESPSFEEAGGAAYVATQVIDLKTSSVESLVLDAGDISEGNPLGDLRGNGGTIDFLEELDSQLKAIPANSGGRGVDAIVVGNHDVRAISMVNNMKTSPLPFISVNILDEGAAIPAPSASPLGNTFAPYVLINVDNDGSPGTPATRVAVLGYSTDDSTILTDETVNVLDVIEVRWSDDDPTTIDLKDWVAHLRKPTASGGEGADVVVLLSHIGHRRLNATDEILLGDMGDVPPPDVVISGHWHTWTDTAWQPSNLNYNTTNVEAASYGQYVGELQITPSGRYVGANKHPIRVADITPNAGVLSLISTLAAEYDAQTDHPCVLPPAVTGNTSAIEPCPLNYIVGHSAVDLSLDKDKWFTLSEFPWSGDNTAGEWITDAMVWKVIDEGGSVDLAFQSGGGVRRDVAAGPVTYLEIYETYPWPDDQMVQVSMSSNDVWRYIESHFVGSSISVGWEVTADDGQITAISYDADGPGPGAPVALVETDTTTMWDVVISEFMLENDDWINETGADFTFQDLPGGSTPLGYSIRESVVEYTSQFTALNPMTVPGPRYVLNTEFAGGFKAVVTMTNDAENQPYFEAVFVRLLEALPETLARRDSYGLSNLVNPDGSINQSNQFSETMLYRSHLGFPDGYLQVGDVIEVWVEGGFFDGNPQIVDQQGIVGAEEEFTLLTPDPSAALPDFKQFSSEFMNEAHENYLVQFQAERTAENTVRDSNGTTLTIYQPGGFFDLESLPGSNGDVLNLIGVQTHRASGTPDRRFRLREATVTSGYSPSSMVDDNLGGSLVAGTPVTLTATASDINGFAIASCQANGSRLAGTSFEEPSTGGIYTDPNSTTAHALVNNPGQQTVMFTTAGGELGFSSFFTPDGNGGSGLSDGDFIGVSNFTGDVGAFTDGTQGYQLHDPDGLVTVTLDTVDLSTQGPASICADIFVPQTNWETSNPLDRLRVWVETNAGDIDLVNSNGSDVDNVTVDGLPLEGVWHTLSADLSSVDSATLKFELASNSAAEELIVDNVTFQDAAPASGGSPVMGAVTQVAFYYSTDGGAPVLIGVDSTPGDGWSVDFTAPSEGNYEFYSQATDGDGIIEPAPIRADAQSVFTASPSTLQIPLPPWALLILASALAPIPYLVRRGLLP